MPVSNDATKLTINDLFDDWQVPYRFKIPHNEAKAVDCPLCGAVIGAPCTYTWSTTTPKPAPTEYPHNMSKTLRKLVEDFGKPMKITHNERKYVQWRNVREQLKEEQIQKFREWLTQYGDIFKC